MTSSSKLTSILRITCAFLIGVMLSSCIMRGKIIVDATIRVKESDGPYVISSSLVGNSPATTSPAAVTIVFNEAVTGLTLSSFHVTNGTVANIAGAGSTYTITITPLSENIVTIKLPAKAVENLASEKNNEESTFSFAYTTSSVVALLTGAPSNVNTQTELAITVGGATVDFYRYKVGPAAGLDCTEATGYSTYTSITNDIEDDLSTVDDGPMKVCVQGRNSGGGIDQPLFAATEYTWTQNSPAKINFTQSSRLLAEDDSTPVTITWNLSHKKSTPVTFNYNYAGTALLAVDHDLTYGQLTIPAGQLSASVNFSLAGNAIPNKDLDIKISINDISSGNATLGDRKIQTIILRDNDSGVLKVIDQFAYRGGNSSCIIYSNNDLYCWGINEYGEVGNNTLVRVSSPVLIGPGYAKVSTNGAHACAIKTDGKLYCWGYNGYGQLGLGAGNTTDSLIPVHIDTLETYSQVSTGTYHTCGITTSKKLKCWGRNSSGRLGDGTTSSRGAPTAIDALSDYRLVSAGHVHTCAIRDLNNALFCWGNNDDDNLGNNNGGVNELSPIAIDAGEEYKYLDANGFGGCAITTDDDLKCWGANYTGEVGVANAGYAKVPTVVDAGVKYKMVAMSSDFYNYASHTCGVTLAGVAKCWGADFFNGALGLGMSVAKEYAEFYSPQIVDAGEAYLSLSPNDTSTCGLTVAGEIKCWGYTLPYFINGSVVRESPTTILNEKNFISASYMDHICALDADGYPYCVNSQDSILTKVDQTSTYQQLVNNCGLRSDNVIICDLHDSPFAPAPGFNFKTFSTRGSAWASHCGIDANDDLYCWGKNFAGQVGNNSKVEALTPILIDSGVKYKFVDVGMNGACGITTANRVKCWGDGVIVGDGNTTENLTPTFINDVTEYKSVSVGAVSTCGITTLNKLKCWGTQNYGQLGNNVNSVAIISTPLAIDSANDYIFVATANAQACAIDSNSKIKCWGQNMSNIFSGRSDNVLGTGSFDLNVLVPTLVDVSTNYKFVEISESKICAISSTNKLRCWGEDASDAEDDKLPFSMEQYFPNFIATLRNP